MILVWVVFLFCHSCAPEVVVLGVSLQHSGAQQKIIGEVVDLTSVVFVEGFDNSWDDAVRASRFVIGKLVEAFIEHGKADIFLCSCLVLNCSVFSSMYLKWTGHLVLCIFSRWGMKMSACLVLFCGRLPAALRQCGALFDAPL